MEHFPLVDRLHTDVLEDRYGSISAKILRHDGIIRESHLVDKKGISRTYALTFFPKKFTHKEIEQINEEIRKGGAIGKVFREHKYAIRKNVLDVYIIELPSWLKKAFKTDSNFAKARISEFYAKKKNSNPVIYGNVVEIYSPDFRPPIINKVDISQISASTDTLGKVGISMSEIWRRLGRRSNYRDIKPKYDRAKKMSLPLVFMFKEKIKRYLNYH
jgi:hypothetical protein